MLLGVGHVWARLGDVWARLGTFGHEGDLVQACIPGLGAGVILTVGNIWLGLISRMAAAGIFYATDPMDNTTWRSVVAGGSRCRLAGLRLDGASPDVDTGVVPIDLPVAAAVDAD